jgi:hypothetical protein
MLLIPGIVALVFGIITVATGKLKLGNGKVVVGAPARVAGVILIASFPMALLIGLMAATLLVVQAGAPITPIRIPMWLDFLPLGVFVLFVMLAFIVGSACSQPLERVCPRSERDYLQREQEASEKVLPVQRPPEDRIRE